MLNYEAIRYRPLLQAQQDSFCSRHFKRMVKQNTSMAKMPWKFVSLLGKAVQSSESVP